MRNTILSRAPEDGAIGERLELLDAHEIVLQESRPLAREAAERGDDGTNDLIVSQVVRTNELQSWFVAEQLQAQDTTGGNAS